MDSDSTLVNALDAETTPIGSVTQRVFFSIAIGQETSSGLAVSAEHTTVQMLATKIKAKSMRPNSAAVRPVALRVHHYRGTSVGVSKGQYLTFDKNGKTQKSFMLSRRAKVTRDGKTVKTDQLRRADFVTVRTQLKPHEQILTAIDVTSHK